eukprot:NODE_9363_length_372_cov_28.461300_g8460_i0.p4 GENE.NODE_9363_length_372_cov_28.461300_g8460_i0~~NODE_9363_length_372_cov_28.461300_g8460_i0.p4  ORF type:complete len:50 (-),score=6.76 NODE_9363_length_372_cov_28.461300_g8460_i0:142-291(-)
MSTVEATSGIVRAHEQQQWVSGEGWRPKDWKPMPPEQLEAPGSCTMCLW